MTPARVFNTYTLLVGCFYVFDFLPKTCSARSAVKEILVLTVLHMFVKR
jgi:hypothetical protein